MVNFPAPQKLDPKISPHGSHTIYDSVCGAGHGQFSCPTKTRPPSPKIEPKPWYFRCLCKTQNNKRSKNTAICDTFATQHVRNAVFYSVFWRAFSKTLVFAVFCENTCTKHRKYQRIQRLHFPWQQATKSKTTDIYSVSAQWFFQKKVLFGPFLVSEASQNKERGVPPHPPSTS